MRVGLRFGPRRDPFRVARGGLPAGLRLLDTATSESIVEPVIDGTFHFLVRSLPGISVLCFAEVGELTTVVQLSLSMFFAALAGRHRVLPTFAGQYYPSGVVRVCGVGPAPESPAPSPRWSVLPVGAVWRV